MEGRMKPLPWMAQVRYFRRLIEGHFRNPYPSHVSFHGPDSGSLF